MLPFKFFRSKLFSRFFGRRGGISHHPITNFPDFVIIYARFCFLPMLMLILILINELFRLFYIIHLYLLLFPTHSISISVAIPYHLDIHVNIALLVNFCSALCQNGPAILDLEYLLSGLHVPFSFNLLLPNSLRVLHHSRERKEKYNYDNTSQDLLHGIPAQAE